MDILIYPLSTQAALSFEDCEILVDDVNLFVFRYRSKQTGELKTAKFYTKNMLGFVTQYPDDSKKRKA